MMKTTGYDIGFRGAGGPPPFSTSALQVGVLQCDINDVTTGIICAESMTGGWLTPKNVVLLYGRGLLKIGLQTCACKKLVG